MLNKTKNIFRLFRIFRVLAKYDALFFLEHIRAFPAIGALAKLVAPVKLSEIKGLREGQRLTLAFNELGGSFIKLGQAMSVRPDITGQEIAKDLSVLQDDLPPFDTKIAKKIIEEELEKNINDLFSEFSDQPIAAASIAQVHFAKDNAGNELAVKVKRPDIDEKFQKDINLFFWIAKNIDSSLPKYRRLRLVEVVEIFAESTRNELDFTFEAAAASELADNFTDDIELRVPKIYWEKTTSKVLVLERFKGTQINDNEALKKAGHTPNEILKNSANIFLKQTLRDGFFHADMHPGNLLVDNNGKIAVFDFGIMGRIDRKTRIYLAEMLLGFLTRDYDKISDIHFEAGYIPKNQNRELFSQACRAIGEPIFDLPQSEISIAKLLEKLFKTTERFQMETQPQLLLLQKTMMMAEGIGRSLNPNINMWEISRTLIEEWGKENLGPKARIEDKILETANTLKSLASTASKFENVITSEGLLIHPETMKSFMPKKQNSSFFYGLFVGVLLILTLYFLLH